MVEPPDTRDKQVSNGLNLILWIVSLVVAFLFVPYTDVFPTGYHDHVPDIVKPLMFGGFAAVLIRAGIGALFGGVAGLNAQRWDEVSPAVHHEPLPAIGVTHRPQSDSTLESKDEPLAPEVVRPEVVPQPEITLTLEDAIKFREYEETLKARIKNEDEARRRVSLECEARAKAEIEQQRLEFARQQTDLEKQRAESWAIAGQKLGPVLCLVLMLLVSAFATGAVALYQTVQLERVRLQFAEEQRREAELVADKEKVEEEREMARMRAEANAQEAEAHAREEKRLQGLARQTLLEQMRASPLVVYLRLAVDDERTATVITSGRFSKDDVEFEKDGLRDALKRLVDAEFKAWQQKLLTTRVVDMRERDRKVKALGKIRDHAKDVIQNAKLLRLRELKKMHDGSGLKNPSSFPVE